MIDKIKTIEIITQIHNLQENYKKQLEYLSQMKSSFVHQLNETNSYPHDYLIGNIYRAIAKVIFKCEDSEHLEHEMKAGDLFVLVDKRRNDDCVFKVIDKDIMIVVPLMFLDYFRKLED